MSRNRNLPVARRFVRFEKEPEPVNTVFFHVVSVQEFPPWERLRVRVRVDNNNNNNNNNNKLSDLKI